VFVCASYHMSPALCQTYLGNLPIQPLETLPARIPSRSVLSAFRFDQPSAQRIAGLIREARRPLLSGQWYGLGEYVASSAAAFS
jgi:hypothetical protein